MNISHIGQHAVIRSWRALKLSYGLLFIIAGADKFFNLVTYWPKYISPLISNLVPLEAAHLAMGVGVAEILLGLAILFFATRIGGYICSAWLILIALNLITVGGYLDIAVRDLIMAVGALVLVWLDEAMPSLRA